MQNRGGKGVRGAQLRDGDFVEHLFPTTSHHWILFFTTAGRVYRTKAYQLPEAGRDAKGGHVAGLLSFQPDEQIAQVLAIRDYEQAPYLVLATKKGLVKKTRLADYNSPRQAGVIAINFRDDDDELIGAELVRAEDDLLLISTQGAGHPVPRRRRAAAADGPRDVRRHRHEVPRRRRPAVDDGHPCARRREGHRGRPDRRDALRVHGHRRRLREEDDRSTSTGSKAVAASASRPCRSPRSAASWWAAWCSTTPTTSSPSPRAARSREVSLSGVPAKGRGTMGVSFVKFKGDDRVVTIARNAEIPTDETRSRRELQTDSPSRRRAERGTEPVTQGRPSDVRDAGQPAPRPTTSRSAQPAVAPEGPAASKPHLVEPVDANDAGQLRRPPTAAVPPAKAAQAAERLAREDGARPEPRQTRRPRSSQAGGPACGWCTSSRGRSLGWPSWSRWR